MFVHSLKFAIAAMFAISAVAVAQDSGMALMKKDVGVWDAKITMFENGEAGEPTQGTEMVHMLGDMWVISHFQGEMMGQPFEGASYTGYNPESKKYFGEWIDSMTPEPMKIEATWDETAHTMTGFGSAKGPDGSDMKMKMTTVYNNDGSRTFSMFMLADDQEMKMMEILYTKAKDQHNEHAPEKATK